MCSAAVVEVVRGVGRARPRWIVVALAAVISTFSAKLYAEPCKAEGDADALFRCGKQRYEAGAYADACEALAKSDGLEPSVSTLGLLAACHEKRGLVATALREYEETERRAKRKNDPRGEFAAERARRLAAIVPRLSLVVPEGETLTVFIDGRALSSGELDDPVLLDPGRIVIEATSASGSKWSTTLDLAPGDKSTLALPRSAPAAVAPSAPEDEGVELPWWPVWVAGGVGIVGFGLMAGAGVSAASSSADSDALEDACFSGGDAGACERGRHARESAQTAATVSNVGLALGSIGIGAAVVLWVVDASTGPSSPNGQSALKLVPMVSAETAGVLMSGTF